MADCGTRSGYVLGCRCEPCRSAQRRYDYGRLHPEASLHVWPCWFCSRSFSSQRGANHHMAAVH